VNEPSADEKALQATALIAQEGWIDILKNGRNSKFIDDLLQMGGNLGFPNGDIVPIPMEGGGYAGIKVYSNDGRKIKEIRTQNDFSDFINYNPVKPTESKVKNKLATDAAKKAGKYVTLSQIKNTPESQRSGLSVTEYANFLRSNNYIVGEE